MDFKKKQFIKWTSSDESGDFSHIGQVVSFDAETVTFATSSGEMTVPINDGTFVEVSKPHTFDVKVEETSTKKKQKAVKRTRSTNGITKLDQVITLLRNDPPTDRKDAINKIVAAGISTANGASTYYSSVKSKL